MSRPAAIFLSGTSSSGKTTLATAPQRAMEEPVLYVSNDKFIFVTPEHVLKLKRYCGLRAVQKIPA